MNTNSYTGFVERNDDGVNNTNTQADPFDPEIVRRARELGWRDKGEYNGPEDRWVSPDEFVRRGEEVLPIVRSQLERERRKVQELEQQQRQIDERLRRQNEEWETRIQRQERESHARAEASARVAQLALQRQRDRFMAELDAAKRSVVPEEARSQYDDLVRREQEFYRSVAMEEEQLRPAPLPEVEEEVRQPAQAEQPRPGQRQLTADELETINDWRRRNPWFDTRPDASRIANSIHENLLAENPGMSLRENLEAVTREMQRRFPDRIGYNPDPQRQTYQREQQSEFYGGQQPQQQPQYSQQQYGGQQQYNQQQEPQNSGQYGYQPQQQPQQNMSQQRQYSAVEGGQSYNNNGGARMKKGWMNIHPNDRELFERTVFPTGVYGKDINKAREQWAADYHSAYEE